MARITPDGVTKVHFLTTISTPAAPTVAELAAGTELTPFLAPAGIDTPEEGQEADSSDLSSRRDKSVPSTVGGQVSAELYRDDADDDAYTALALDTVGFLVIGRFGGTGTANALIATDTAEVWAVRVSQRSNIRVARGDTLRFVANFAVSADVVAATIAA